MVNHFNKDEKIINSQSQLQTPPPPLQIAAAPYLPLFCFKTLMECNDNSSIELLVDVLMKQHHHLHLP